MGCDVGYGLLHRIPRRKSDRDADNTGVEERQRSDSINYSDTIFNAPELNNSDEEQQEEAENTLNEAKQTELPSSPLKEVTEDNNEEVSTSEEVPETSEPTTSKAGDDTDVIKQKDD